MIIRAFSHLLGWRSCLPKPRSRLTKHQRCLPKKCPASSCWRSSNRLAKNELVGRSRRPGDPEHFLQITSQWSQRHSCGLSAHSVVCLYCSCAGFGPTLGSMGESLPRSLGPHVYSVHPAMRNACRKPLAWLQVWCVCPLISKLCCTLCCVRTMHTSAHTGGRGRGLGSRQDRSTGQLALLPLATHIPQLLQACSPHESCDFESAFEQPAQSRKVHKTSACGLMTPVCARTHTQHTHTPQFKEMMGLEICLRLSDLCL